MVKVETQKIVFNGGTILSALEDSKISPENFFGTKLETIKQIKSQMEVEAGIEAFSLMHPLQMVELGAQGQFKLVHGWAGDTC